MARLVGFLGKFAITFKRAFKLATLPNLGYCIAVTGLLGAILLAVQEHATPGVGRGEMQAGTQHPSTPTIDAGESIQLLHMSSDRDKESQIMKGFSTYSSLTGADANNKNDSIVEVAEAPEMPFSEHPCPRLKIANDKTNTELVNVAIRVRGPDTAEQLASAHERLQSCYAGFLGAQSGVSPLTIYDEGDRETIVAVASQLPSDFEVLTDYVQWNHFTRHIDEPTYEMVIHKAALVLVDTSLGPENGDPTFPDLNARQEVCQSLLMPKDCLRESDIMSIPRIDEPDRVASYNSYLRMYEGVITFRVPQASANVIANDITYFVSLMRHQRNLSEDVTPQRVIRGAIESGERGDGSRKFTDKCMSNLSQFRIQLANTKQMIAKQEEGAANQERTLLNEISTEVRRFWYLNGTGFPHKTIFHPPDFSAIYGTREMEPRHSPEQPVNILLVDFIERNHPSQLLSSSPVNIPRPLLGFPPNHRGMNAPGSGGSKLGATDLLDPSEADELGHTVFAAHIIGGRNRLKVGEATDISAVASQIRRLNDITGIAGPRQQYDENGSCADGVCVEIFDSSSYNTALSNITNDLHSQKKLVRPLTYGTFDLTRYNVISAVYSPYTCGKYSEGERSGAKSVISTFNLFLSGLEVYNKSFGDGELKKPLWVISAPQFKKACEEDSFYDNRKLLKEGGLPTSVEEVDELHDYDRWSGGAYWVTKCPGYTSKGFHCQGANPDVLVVAALNQLGDRPRNDNRLSFAYTSFLAPGTNLVAGDYGPDHKPLLTKEKHGSFGVRCGSSFAGPSVAGIAGLLIDRFNLSTERIKPHLAVTASINRVEDLFEKNIVHGTVNLERALLTDPDHEAKYAIWLKPDIHSDSTQELFYVDEIWIPGVDPTKPSEWKEPVGLADATVFRELNTNFQRQSKKLLLPLALLRSLRNEARDDFYLVAVDQTVTPVIPQAIDSIIRLGGTGSSISTFGRSSRPPDYAGNNDCGGIEGECLLYCKSPTKRGEKEECSVLYTDRIERIIFLDNLRSQYPRSAG